MNYKKYKPSGIEWIGEIPEHWEVSKLKYALDSLGSGSREAGGGSIAEGIFSIGGEHIGWLGELLLDNPKYISENYFDNLKNGKIRENDVLLVKDGATIGKCSIVKSLPFEKCAVNEHVFILRVNQKFSSKYLFYFIWCRIGQEQILLNVRGSAQPGLNSQFINEVFIPIPPLHEQTAIANFLDDKTAKIDSLIEKKKKLIELYKEERTAVINQAVTRGINPNVKLKPSGIEWLGDIPEHWEVNKMKHILKQNKGALKPGPFGSDLKNSDVSPYGNYKVYTQKNIIENNYELGVDFISDDKFEELKAFEIFADDILVTTRGTIGRTAIFPQGVPKGVLHPCLIRLQINPLKSLNEWLILYFNESSYFIENVKLNSNSTVIDVIYGYTLREVLIPIPPIEEQKQIVEYIEAETKRIDAKIAKTEKEIELLQEYRTALISEVVTGKIKIIDN